MRWLLKRWWFWAGAGFMLVAVCAGFLLIPAEQARITQENCDKIQLGWSAEQVVSLLGPHTRFSGTGTLINTGLVWRDDDDNSIIVQFEMEHVIGKAFEPSTCSFKVGCKRRIERRIRALWP
jgi:hypothetical protein